MDMGNNADTNNYSIYLKTYFMKKLKCKVIMLPQPQQRSDFTILSKQLSNGKLVLSNGRIFGEVIPQHLYFISDRGSKKGEWTLFGNSLNGELKDFIGGKPIKAKYDYGSNGIYNFKIEATTDKSLGLPIIPESFVEEFVKHQCKSAEVYIKMNDALDIPDQYIPENSKGPIDGWNKREVIIVPCKNSWNREEMKKEMYNAWVVSADIERDKIGIFPNAIAFSIWFNKNY